MAAGKKRIVQEAGRFRSMAGGHQIFSHATLPLRNKWARLRAQALALKETAILLPALRRRTIGDCDANHVVMLAVSALRIDPRVERSARALVSAGYRVTVICPDISDPPLKAQPLDWGPGIEFRILGWEAASYIDQFPWLNGRLMYEAAITYRPLAFHCHDLTTALAGLAAARQVGAACVCDFHEWFSENVSWDRVKEAYVPHPKGRRHIYKLSEALAIRRADEIITVCDSIARELERKSLGRRRINVIRNIPPLNTDEGAWEPLRDSLGVDAGQFLVLWSGGTGPTRLLEPIIESLVYAPDVAFAIRGPSLDLFGAGYRERARKAGVESRLYLLPPVRSRDVVAAARGADAGVWSLPNLCKNFYYALPNKIFEYMAAGLPFAGAAFPEVKAIADRYAVGVTFDPYDPRSIGAALMRLSEPEFHRRCRDNIQSALEDLNARREWSKLAALYGRIRSRHVARDADTQLVRQR